MIKDYFIIYNPKSGKGKSKKINCSHLPWTLDSSHSNDNAGELGLCIVNKTYTECVQRCEDDQSCNGFWLGEPAKEDNEERGICCLRENVYFTNDCVDCNQNLPEVCRARPECTVCECGLSLYESNIRHNDGDSYKKLLSFLI